MGAEPGKTRSSGQPANAGLCSSTLLLRLLLLTEEGWLIP